MIKRMFQWLGLARLSREQVAARYMSAIRRALPGAEPSYRDGLIELTLPGVEGPIQAAVDNLYALYLTHPRKLPEILEGYTGQLLTLAASSATMTVSEASLPALLPMVRHAGSFDGLPGEVLTFPLAGDLVVALAIDLPSSLFYLNRSHLEALNRSAEELRAIACENLERRLPAGDLELPEQEGLLQLTLDGIYDASLLLLPRVREQVARRLPDPVVALPARHLVVAVSGRNGELTAALTRVAARNHQEADHPITARLYDWAPGGLMPRSLEA